MTDPVEELQNAAYSRLTTGDNNISYPVYDYGNVPKNLPINYILIGDVHSVAWNSKNNPGTDTLLTFHMWSNAKTKLYVSDMKNAILGSITVTDDGGLYNKLSLLSFNTIRQDYDNSDVFYDEAAVAYHGILTVSFWLEQN